MIDMFAFSAHVPLDDAIRRLLALACNGLWAGFRIFCRVRPNPHNARQALDSQGRRATRMVTIPTASGKRDLPPRGAA
jgi:hypothetical protein